MKQTIVFTGNVESKSNGINVICVRWEELTKHKHSIGKKQRTNRGENVNQKKENKRSIILIDYSGSEHV